MSASTKFYTDPNKYYMSNMKNKYRSDVISQLQCHSGAQYPCTLTSVMYVLSALWYTCEWNEGCSKPGVSPRARMDISESGRDPACNACYCKYSICEHI